MSWVMLQRDSAKTSCPITAGPTAPTKQACGLPSSLSQPFLSAQNAPFLPSQHIGSYACFCEIPVGNWELYHFQVCMSSFHAFPWRSEQRLSGAFCYAFWVVHRRKHNSSRFRAEVCRNKEGMIFTLQSYFSHDRVPGQERGHGRCMPRPGIGTGRYMPRPGMETGRHMPRPGTGTWKGHA